MLSYNLNALDIDTNLEMFFPYFFSECLFFLDCHILSKCYMKEAASGSVSHTTVIKISGFMNSMNVSMIPFNLITHRKWARYLDGSGAYSLAPFGKKISFNKSNILTNLQKLSFASAKQLLSNVLIRVLTHFQFILVVLKRECLECSISCCIPPMLTIIFKIQL